MRYAFMLLSFIVLSTCALGAKSMDPYTTVLPTYVLPDSAKIDGRLADWTGVPPITAELFKDNMRNETIIPSENFAPSLRCGMKQGSNDLYLLLIVADSQLYGEDSPHWFAGDFLDLFLDFGREARDREIPAWYKENEKKWHTPPGMGQFGFRPRTIQVAEAMLNSGGSNNWKCEFASALVEGGVAYEIRIDAQSVMTDLKYAAFPAYIGIDMGIMDQDYMVRMRTDGWTNDKGVSRLFGDGMAHAFPTKYGMLSTRPIAIPPVEETLPPLPKTLESAFGEFPTPQYVQSQIGKLPANRLADLVIWAACQGTVLDAKLVTALMATGSPDVQEKTLTALYFSEQEEDAVKAALDRVYAGQFTDGKYLFYAGDFTKMSPYVLTLANLLNAKYQFGYREAVRTLLASDDLTVAITAARTLANVGVAEDVAFLEQSLQTQVDKLQAQITLEPKRKKELDGYLFGYRFFFGSAKETLIARTEPITIPTFTPVREIKAKNTDLERYIPIDGNNVYNGAGLLRSWPKDGPKELWRREVGPAKSAVVEAQGRAFTATLEDGKQWALCLDALTGATIWKVPIAEVNYQAIATPVIDGERVYYVPSRTAQEDGFGIVCLQTADGKELWRAEGDLQFTESSSTPLIVGNVIYCPLYSGRAVSVSPLAAVDKMTGKILWKAPITGRRGSGISSPTYQIIDGIPQVIISVYNNPLNEVWGVSAETGELFWRYAPNSHYGLIPSPVAVGTKVFVCDNAPPFSACLQMYVRDGKIKARQLYSSDKIQCNLYNTVAVVDNAVLGCSGSSVQCTDLDTGKLLWKKEGKDWSSVQQLIVADGLTFALANFDLIMVETSRTGMKELGRVKHDIKLGYPQQPSIANGRLYLRGETWVVCYDLRQTK